CRSGRGGVFANATPATISPRAMRLQLFVRLWPEPVTAA
ncbi:MAG: hypothetical protein AVDCRST_MAG88-3363, partial [uncultured Thermomicrobiales bacterium]